MQVVMRLGWEVPNPINAENPNEETRFPFALVEPATAPTTYTVTFTVKDDAGTPVAVEGAEVISKLSVTVSQLLGNKEMYLVIGIFILTTIAVYIIRKLTIDHA